MNVKTVLTIVVLFLCVAAGYSLFATGQYYRQKARLEREKADIERQEKAKKCILDAEYRYADSNCTMNATPAMIAVEQDAIAQCRKQLTEMRIQEIERCNDTYGVAFPAK